MALRSLVRMRTTLLHSTFRVHPPIDRRAFMWSPSSGTIDGMDARRRIRHWSFPPLAMVVGYLVFVVAASRAPKGLNAHQVDVPAVITGYIGLAVSGLACVIGLRRAMRWLRHTMPRPGDRALAYRWIAAASRAQYGATHLVLIRDVQRFAPRGAAARCEPCWPDLVPHSSWFEGHVPVAPGEWMEAAGKIGSGHYGDQRVLYVAEVLQVFPARAPAVAGRLRKWP